MPQASTSNAWLYWPMFDNLVQFGKDYEIRPSIAERWQLSQDSRTWTFWLRRDVEWPGGPRLTANDVVFTINTMLQPSWPQRSSLVSISSIRAVDEWTVEISTYLPNMALLNSLPAIWILPKATIDAIGFDGFRDKPVGSGPYELVDFKANASMAYRKRSAHHAFRKPILDELRFAVIQDKSLGRNNQLLGDLYAFGSGDTNGYWTFNRTYFGCGRPLGGHSNSTYFCNPEIDRFYDAAIAEPDAIKRIQLMQQAARIMRDDVPMIFGTVNTVLVVFNVNIRGLDIANGSFFNFDNTYKVSQ